MPRFAGRREQQPTLGPFESGRAHATIAVMYGRLFEHEYSPVGSLVEPLDTDSMNLYLNLPVLSPPDATSDAIVSDLILSARETAEGLNNRIFTRRAFRRVLDCWLPEIPLHTPVVSVETFRYRTKAGAWVDLVEGTDFYLDADAKPGFVAPLPDGEWPSADLWPSSSIEIIFIAGPGDGSPEPTVPARILSGMRLLVSHLYHHRLPVEVGSSNEPAEVPFTVTEMLEKGAVPRRWEGGE